MFVYIYSFCLLSFALKNFGQPMMMQKISLKCFHFYNNSVIFYVQNFRTYFYSFTVGNFIITTLSQAAILFSPNCICVWNCFAKFYSVKLISLLIPVHSILIILVLVYIVIPGQTITPSYYFINVLSCLLYLFLQINFRILFLNSNFFL